MSDFDLVGVTQGIIDRHLDGELATDLLRDLDEEQQYRVACLMLRYLGVLVRDGAGRVGTSPTEFVRTFHDALRLIEGTTPRPET